jgi:hypothetical protein
MARSCLIAGQRKITRYGPEAIDTAKCFMFKLFAIGAGRVKRVTGTASRLRLGQKSGSRRS